MRSLNFISIVIFVVTSVSVEAANNVQSNLKQNLFSMTMDRTDGQVEMKVGLNIYSLAYCPVKEVRDISLVQT